MELKDCYKVAKKVNVKITIRVIPNANHIDSVNAWFIHDSREVLLEINNNAKIKYIIGSILHELGHAVDFNNYSDYGQKTENDVLWCERRAWIIAKAIGRKHGHIIDEKWSNYWLKTHENDCAA